MKVTKEILFMSGYDMREIATKIVTIKATDFTKKLKGRYKNLISDEFIIAYITYNFVNLYMDHRMKGVKSPNAINIAYDSCIELFESILEHRCNATGNGHHVAQMFTEYFEDTLITNKELRKLKLQKIEKL